MMHEAIDEFISITNIDSRHAAEYFLNACYGNIPMAIEYMFGCPIETWASSIEVFESGETPGDEVKTDHVDKHPIAEQNDKSCMTVLEWNIQGLLNQNLRERTFAVVDLIREHKPTVVLLQEVITQSYFQMKSELKSNNYHGFSYAELGIQIPYFTAIFINAMVFEPRKIKHYPFFKSKQGMDVIVFEGRCHNLDVAVLTSHLKCTKSRAPGRKRELCALYSIMMNYPPSTTVIFGGDTNLRDAEFRSIIHFNKSRNCAVKDVWKMLGSPRDARYTWDLLKNDNCSFTFGRARLRFDRIFMKVEKSPTNQYFKPTSMKLVGMDRLPCGLFPSDHWGILTSFTV